MEKKIFKTPTPNIVLFPLALTIVGCTSVSYEEPKSGPVARVRFVTNRDGITVIRSYKSKKCDGGHEMMRISNGFDFNSSLRRLGIPLWDYHHNAAKELFIRANIPQVYMFQSAAQSGSYIYKCGVFVQQKFEEGKDYELSYKLDNNNCNLEVYEIKTNASGNPEKVLLQKRDKQLLPDFSESCLVKFKQPRWF
ncbi:hypothetical protein [Candidatus Odyssella acanthamoebae]|uniref:Lipoprotein n=1 Tax=Candidatus Odyssella acanthamoebae TaxID=91604 RepID=A0A077AY34_9PROT|nr:hypothetical protein [Candidatus Paracaedibacter acanthamoebae]AIK96553.1 hypothetical protein ID47_07095 [Candidatus Paracaedibacter acanthamoebae]